MDVPGTSRDADRAPAGVCHDGADTYTHTHMQGKRRMYHVV